MWLREGVARLISAGRFLTPEIMALHPRLELLHCIILRLSSQFAEANALFDAVARKTDGFTRDRDGGSADALAVDRVFTEGVLVGGAERLPPDELDARLPAAAGDEAAGRNVARARHVMSCFVCYERARLEESRQHGLRAQAHFADDVRFGDVFVNICLGMSAMAQGRVQEAAVSYGRARQGARKFFASDPCLTVSTDVLAIELDLERNLEKTVQRRTLQSMAEVRGVWIDVYATAIAVTADSKAVIPLLTKAVDTAAATGIDSLSHHMSALLAYYLVEVGRSGEAARLWRDHGLPCDPRELLDLDRQSWRTMEALSCARIQLLAAQGEYGAAEDLARSLCSVAAERGLVRSLLRGVALSMITAHGAGRADGALARLVEFLRLTREVDYIRPLVRHRTVSRTLLRQLLDGDLAKDMRPAAESMLVQLDDPSTAASSIFSARELEVLAGTRRGLRNKEIAGRLGITDEGVRYHMRRRSRRRLGFSRQPARPCRHRPGAVSGVHSRRRRARDPQSWLVAGVLLCATVPTGAQPSPAGALAIDERRGDQYGWAVDYETAGAARQRALSECGAGCSVVLTFNRCGAYAADQDADSTAVGWAESYTSAAGARQAALAECRSRGGTGCIVRVWGCNGQVVEEELGLDQTARRQIQEGLEAAGFDPGVADGVFGPRTRAAIRSWQSSRGGRTTGYLDTAQGEALRDRGRSEPPATASPTPSAASSAEVEVVFWQSIVNSTNPADFEAYLAQFPNGAFRPLAENRLTALRAPASVPPAVGGAGSPATGTAVANAPALDPPNADASKARPRFSVCLCKLLKL